jgi:hypothetical protein
LKEIKRTSYGLGKPRKKRDGNREEKKKKEIEEEGRNGRMKKK